MIRRLSFIRLVIGILVVSFIAGIALFILSGATTNKDTTGAIAAEYAKIVAAEKTSCHIFGRYASVTTLRGEGLLNFKPVYNSVVYVPGKGCGSVVVGSAAYQSPAG